MAPREDMDLILLVAGGIHPREYTRLGTLEVAHVSDEPPVLVARTRPCNMERFEARRLSFRQRNCG